MMFKLTPSKRLQNLCRLFLALLFIWILICPIILAAKIIFCLLTTVIAFLQETNYRQQLAAKLRIGWAAGEWLLATNNGPALPIEFKKNMRIWPQLIVLTYRLINKPRFKTLLILKDSLAAEEFRRLKIALLEHIKLTDGELRATAKVYNNTSSPSGSQLLNGGSAE